MNQCIVPELKLLYDGFGCIDDNTKTIYIVQARLIVHNFDTRALEKAFYFQSSSSSYNGCFLCPEFCALVMQDPKRSILSGHRNYLPVNNILRFYGEAKACCPVDFFGKFGSIPNPKIPVLKHSHTKTEGTYNNRQLVNHTMITSCDKSAWDSMLSLTDQSGLCCFPKTITDLLSKSNVYLCLTSWKNYYNNSRLWPYESPIESYFVKVQILSIIDMTCTKVKVYTKLFHEIKVVSVDELHLTCTGIKFTEQLYKEIENEIYMQTQASRNRGDAADIVYPTEYIKLLEKRDKEEEQWEEALEQEGEEEEEEEEEKGRKKAQPTQAQPTTLLYYNNPQRALVHSEFTIEDFHQILFYPFCDFRRPFTRKRLSNDEYFKFAREVENNPMIEAYGGVKSLNPFSSGIPYFQIEDLIYDDFHAISNVAVNLLETLKGDKPVTLPYKMRAQSLGIFPSLYREVERDEKNKIINGFRVEPWLLTPGEQYKIDSFVNSILWPIGYKDNSVSFVFQHTGKLDGTAATKLISTSVLIYGFLALDSGSEFFKHYVKFFCMLVKDMSQLLSPALSKNDIIEIIVKIYEMISIKEGIFPDTSALIIYHQVSHLAAHIYKTGPVACNNTLEGERFIHFLKVLRTNGGKDPTAVIIKRFLAKEQNLSATYFNLQESLQADKKITAQLNKYYVGTNSDGFPVFFDYPLKLIRKQQKLSLCLNEWEKNSLLMALVKEIRKQTVDDADMTHALIKSSLYRLYLFWTSSTLDETFYSCLKALFANQNDHIINNVPDEKYEYIDVKIPDFVRGEGYKKNVLLLDLFSVMDFLDSLDIPVFSQAIIYGEKFRGRGLKFSETEPGGEPKNRVNNLQMHCTYKKNYSSWALIHSHSQQAKVGNLNYFFHILILNDDILYGVPFASITCRKFNTLQYGLLYQLNLNNNTYDEEIQFIGATDISPIVFGVGLLDKNKKAIRVGTKHQGQSKMVLKQYADSQTSSPIPELLTLIKLNNKLEKIKYRSNFNKYYNLQRFSSDSLQHCHTPPPVPNISETDI